MHLVEFEVEARLEGALGRTGLLTTPHGAIRTPAFVPVGTQATIKGVLPEAMADLGAQAILANAYHLYLRPGTDVVSSAGGVGAFMNWPGVTFTDSGGFQVLSLGAGFKKVLSMDSAGVSSDDVIAPRSQRLATVDDDGVTFRSHIDGSSHRFTPEVSMQIQHALGADIIFAFDECTTLVNTRAYQEASVARTEAWAERCLTEHVRLGSAQGPAGRVDSGPSGGPALFAVVQGAQHEDLRRMAARRLAALRVPSSTHDDGASFDGFGIGGALEKENLESIVGWVSSELPENKPRHLLGISGIDDLFAGVAAGADTFDCVAPTRTARHGAAFTPRGPVNVKRAGFRSDFNPLDSDCDCYTCAHYSCAYLHHLVRAGEMTGATLLTIHNLRWIIRLVDTMREAIPAGTFPALRQETLAHYHPHPA